MPDTEIKRLDVLTLLERAARGVGRVDHHGRRGVVSMRESEIEAMALVLAILNFPQIAPGEQLADPAAFFDASLRPMIQKELINVI